MRSVLLDFADARFPARLVDVDEPPLPGRRWARVRVLGGGICGSDLHMFRETTGPIPLLAALVPIPLQLGHEVGGVVVETGPDCPVKSGTRVAIDPVISCVAREIDPPCRQCAAGAPAACHNLGSRAVTPGPMLGFTYGLGAGWSDEVVAHASMLHPLPEAVPDRAITLHEPLSIAIHGLLRCPPPDGAPVLVCGVAIIGLAAVAALRTLFPSSDVTVLAKHPHQARAAERLGAKHVVRFDADGGHIEALAALAGTHVLGGASDRLLAGGFPYVVEAVGTPQSLTQALRFADGRGTVLLLGLTGRVNVDLSPIWLKEIALVGAVNHAPDAGPHGGSTAHSLDRALKILARPGFPVDALVTHEVPLGEFRRGVETALDRAESGAIKVVLRP
jgi:threonine dehydrogenase-like Zn-dependent dehydrogenase